MDALKCFAQAVAWPVFVHNFYAITNRKYFMTVIRNVRRTNVDISIVKIEF